MSIRTLAEAASDVLSRSAASAPKEPMQKLAGVTVDEIGGSTNEKPQGDPIGKKVADRVKQAKRPGNKPAIEGDQVAKKLREESSDEDDSDDDFEYGDEGDEDADDDSDEDDSEDDDDEDIDEDYEDDGEELLSEEELLDMIRAKMKSIPFDEHMNAMFGDEQLSEDFMRKVQTVFEAAVIERAMTIVEEIESDILDAAEILIDEEAEYLNEQMNAYTRYVAGEWLEENRVAVESGLKNELTEDFMRGLRDLFIEHYIEIPESETDVVEALAEQVEELEAELNSVLHQNKELSEAILASMQDDIIDEICEGLTATQTEKIRTLAEGVEFTTVGEYAEKVGIIRDSYFSHDGKPATGQVPELTIRESLAEDVMAYSDGENTPDMSHYVNAISRSIPRA